MQQIPDLSEQYETMIRTAIADVDPQAAAVGILGAYYVLQSAHPTVPTDIIQEWVARIFWRFRFTDLKNAS